jgi:thiamine-phosphate pyrophosphorylase
MRPPMRLDADRLRLMAVLDREWFRGRPPDGLAEAVLDGGATVIQYRDKVSGVREMVETAIRLREATAVRGAALIVNDRLDVALAAGADGIHVGQTDIPVPLIRRIAPGLGIGVSVSSIAEFLASPDADYYGVGACFPTGTKAVDRIPGTPLVREIRGRTERPIVAIGGIGPDNVTEAVAAGADGIAAVSAFFRTEDVRAAARRMKDIIEGATR